jgi:hypothetical protein
MWAYTAEAGGDSASAPVAVRIPTLTLTASKSGLAFPGENDTFTATANDTLLVQGWSFIPDDAISPSMQRQSVSGIPNISGKAASIAERSSAKHHPRHTFNSGSLQSLQSSRVPAQPSALLVPIGPRYLSAAGSSWGNCVQNVAQCTNFVAQSGIVVVTGTVGGTTLTTTVHVAVIPCPTQDSILDNPYIRKDLDSLWRLGWPDTNNATNRIERSALVYRDSLGSV